MKYPLGIPFGIPLLLTLLPACAPRTISPVSPRAIPTHGIYHVVQPGETLYRIGKAYAVSVEALVRANGIKDPDRIRTGQRLLIPGASRELPVGTIAPADVATEQGSPPTRTEESQEVLIWPVTGTINSGYGARGAGFHDGIDIAAPEGMPIHAVERGEVIYSDEIRGYGKIVIIRHGGGIVSVYAHNQVNLVRVGQTVERGEIIAKVGSTGRVTGPHLHFEIRKNNLAQDPMRYLPRLCCLSTSDAVAPDRENLSHTVLGETPN